MRIDLVIAVQLLAAAAHAEMIAELHTYDGYETGGVEVKLSTINTSETGKLWINREGEWVEQHPFVRYDANHLASSLFGLKPETEYKLRVEVTNPGGLAETAETTLKTRPE